MVTSSGLKAASAAINARASKLVGVLVQTDGTNAGTVTIYDNASAASGTILFQAVVLGADRNGFFNLGDNYGVEANAGLYLSLSGTGCTAIVYYKA